MAKRKRKATADGEVSSEEQTAPSNGAGGSFRTATEVWKEERRAYVSIKRSCEALKFAGVADPVNLDKFVERVFRYAGVQPN